jgi:hypothetical protein
MLPYYVPTHRVSRLILSWKSGYSLPAQAHYNNHAVIAVKTSFDRKQRPEGIDPWRQ